MTNTIPPNLWKLFYIFGKRRTKPKPSTVRMVMSDSDYEKAMEQVKEIKQVLKQ